MSIKIADYLMLSVSTSTGYASVALLTENKTFCITDTGFNMQSENLPSNVENILTQHNMSFADISHIAVDVGPGSFTGIRSGTTYVAGILLALNQIMIVQVETLFALASTRPDIAIGMSVIQCHKQRFYVQLFTHGVKKTQPIVLAIQDINKFAKLNDCRDIIVHETSHNIFTNSNMEYDIDLSYLRLWPTRLDANTIGQCAKYNLKTASRDNIIIPNYVKDFIVKSTA